MGQTILDVADMDCKRCASSIRAALEAGQISTVVDFATKTVSIDDLNTEQALAIITNAGYTPVKQTT